MDTKLLEDILNCQTLPSLPAVAIRVLELTSDPDVKMDELAKEIQFDQGIAAKILRTVNSSFYGLRKRCASIDHALIMLGLGPVKSLVLGFSLVSTVKGEEGDEFDYIGYWQRGLSTAVASKFAADMVDNKKIIDEVFLAGLFQDIGMVAMHRTIGKEYLDVVNAAEGDHNKLPRLELDAFEIQHSTVGAMLCENWKIPHEIVIPVRYHDRPTACPPEFSQRAKCVAMGNLIHTVLAAENPTESLRNAYAKGSRWLGLTDSQVDELITNTGATTKELGNLFSIDVSSVPDPEEVLNNADRQLIELSKNQQIEGYAAKQFADLVESDDGTDPITGVLMRDGFTLAVNKVFKDAHAGEFTLSILQVVLNGYDELASVVGERAQDEVVIGTTVLLRRQFEHMGGIVCRLADSIFAVVIPGAERAEVTQIASTCCDEFSKRLPGWFPDADGVGDCVKLSMGVATVDDESRPTFKSPELLVQAASRAVLAAKSSEGSAVRAFVPRNKAA
jgi:HD-like signal output (HDOD) protein/GGDEF domain-containing protein